ncbi:MAG TPA: hypothetical protein VEP29_06715, partial [Desulfatiglandales bacterium]|nr:hypothetical protein [Desulfatiglandales bacterium]
MIRAWSNLCTREERERKKKLGLDSLCFQLVIKAVLSGDGLRKVYSYKFLYGQKIDEEDYVTDIHKKSSAYRVQYASAETLALLCRIGRRDVMLFHQRGEVGSLHA